MLRLLLLASFVALTAAPSLKASDESEPPAVPGPAEGVIQKKIDPAFPPMPKVIPAPQPPLVLVLPYQRTDTREVWQHYAPNRMGRMVPRVIVTPYGNLYSRTLEPYPGIATPSNVMPKVVD